MGRLPAKSKNVMQNGHIPPIHFELADFQRALLDWYDGARRDLPWRARPGEKADPYKVWLSEIMLQQTTVKAVIPYFETFLARWPEAEALAAASRDEVLAVWAGLGYYSRARNLYACAQAVAREGFPTSEAALRALPGVGAYTAAAIVAIAFGEPAAVVDGNVERVIARLFAVAQPLPAAKPAIRELAARLTPLERPGDYAQGMMDLGATVCTPRAPSCLACPARRFCAASARGEAERFPVKAPKAERPVRRGDAFVIVRAERRDPHILLRRRKDKGLLGGMMEVPCSEWMADASPATSPSEETWTEGRTVQHTFTHFHLEMRVLAAHHYTVTRAAEAFGGDWATLANLSAFALPAVMKKAVASGLEALGLELPDAQPSFKAARRASKVMTVERSARPSTRAGRK
jgi:A/G-specific adenine glycosylase